MKKIITLIIGFAMMFSLVACTSKTNNQTPSNDNTPSTTIPFEDTTPTINPKEDDNMKSLELKIDDTTVDVTWLDNSSVNALKEVAKDGLTINMSKYGGFEQVGSIGSTLPSADTRITTSPGDIVLYSSNQIVIFYGSNTWSYTKLGHINLSKSSLTDLLGDEDVTITLTLK